MVTPKISGPEMLEGITIQHWADFCAAAAI
jgi:hypothetical protein